MTRTFIKVSLVILCLVSITLPSFAESRKDQILKGVYNMAKEFIKSGSGFNAQGSFSYNPSNGNNQNYSLNQPNNNYYQSSNPYSQYSPNNQPSYNPYESYYNPSETMNYYPISDNNYSEDAMLSTAPRYNIQPKTSAIKPTGQILLLNARKEDVIVLLHELSSSKGWSFIGKDVDNFTWDNITLNNRHNYDYNFYKLTFERSGRALVVSINQYSNGTEIKAYTSSFLVKDQLSEVLAYFTNYYQLQVSQFE